MYLKKLNDISKEVDGIESKIIEVREEIDGIEKVRVDLCLFLPIQGCHNVIMIGSFQRC